MSTHKQAGVAARIAALVERHDLPRTLALDLSAGSDDALVSDLEAMTDRQAAEFRRLWLSREQTAASLTAARTATEPICEPNGSERECEICESAYGRCKAFACGERQDDRHTEWWCDYGCCSRACTVDYYGPEVLP
jgi:hypothetical protein